VLSLGIDPAQPFEVKIARTMLGPAAGKLRDFSHLKP